MKIKSNESNDTINKQTVGKRQNSVKFAKDVRT